MPYIIVLMLTNKIPSVNSKGTMDRTIRSVPVTLASAAALEITGTNRTPISTAMNAFTMFEVSVPALTIFYHRWDCFYKAAHP